MTACVNRKHTKKVAAVVTASLVGALSLGVAPVVAMADDGIAVQSVTATDALEGGTLTGAVDIDNKAIEIPATGEITFTADGKPQGVVPTEITMAAGNATKKIKLNDFQYTLQYFTAHADFTKDAACGTPVAVGKYVVEMTLTSGDYAGATISVPFEIKAASLEGLTAVDSIDGSFEYDGTNQFGNIDYKIGDKFIDSSLFTVTSVSFSNEKGEAVWEANPVIKDAGDYSIVLVGKPGTIYAGSETEVKLAIDKLDLSDAVVVADDDLITNMTRVGSAYTPRMVSINGSIWSNLSGDVDVTFKSGPKGSNLIKDTGVYTYTVKAKAGNANVESSCDFTFTAVDAMATDFKYQGSPMPSYLNIDKSAGQSFTGDKIQVFKADGSELNSGEYTVTVKNAKTGANATLDEVNTPGKWVVTVKVNAEANGYTLGGSATMTVTTIAGTVETAANLYFIYDGTIVDTSVTTEYDGSDKLDGLQVVMTDAHGKELTEGTDYKVTVTDNAGNSYDSVVDAGKYTVTVTSDSYVIDTTGDTAGQNKLTLTVTPVAVEDVRIADDAFTVYNDATKGQQAFLPYTGSAINPAIEYKNSEGEWVELPSDLYTLTFAYSENYSTTPLSLQEGRRDVR